MLAFLPMFGLLAAIGATSGRPTQSPFSDSISEHRTQLGLPWEEVVGLPTINTWSLNPSGEAAIIRVLMTDVKTDQTSYDLHLLAVNPQYTIPSVHYGPTSPDSLYTFISDVEFVTLSPHGSQWGLTIQTLNYTIPPPAYPPSASKPLVIGEFTFDAKPTTMVYSAKAETLSLVMNDAVETGSLALIRLRLGESCWMADRLVSVGHTANLVIDEIVASETQVAFVAHNPTIRPWNSTRSILYTLDLSSPSSPVQISTGKQGAVSSPSFSVDGKIAWLGQRQDGNIRDQRRLWLKDGEEKWEVDLDFDLSPLKVLFSKNGEALNLLTLHDQEMSLYHLWTPQQSSKSIVPTLIPSKGTIYEATHVGISALKHSHLVGLKSSLKTGKELFIISHSPYEDPTDIFEEIRLTFFTEGTLQKRELSSGEKFEFTNEVGDTIQARVFLPSLKDGEKAPMIVYFHGDEEGGGWHDWWMAYWNPNVFVNAGYAVLTINPTGAEGYSNNFTQARTYNWGNRTINDLERGVKRALRHYPVDSEKLVGMGYGAFGGFVAHWFQGHNELGFKAFVSHNGILSPRWWAHTTSTPAVANWEFGPISYAADSPFTLWDPERFISKWRTPELVITDGMDDGDTGPPSQSLAIHGALQSQNIPHCQLLRSTSNKEWHEATFSFLEATIPV